MGDWLSGVVQGIFGTLIYDLLLAAVVAAIIAWLRSKKPALAAPAMYGIAAFSALLFISYLLVGHAVFAKPQTNADNVEENVKAWATNLGMGTQPIPLPDMYFAFKITLTNDFRSGHGPGRR